MKNTAKVVDVSITSIQFPGGVDVKPLQRVIDGKSAACAVDPEEAARNGDGIPTEPGHCSSRQCDCSCCRKVRQVQLIGASTTCHRSSKDHSVLHDEVVIPCASNKIVDILEVDSRCVTAVSTESICDRPHGVIIKPDQGVIACGKVIATTANDSRRALLVVDTPPGQVKNIVAIVARECSNFSRKVQ